MPYNCGVCLKQVPDTKHITGQTMKDDGTVTIIAMGLPKACDVLRSGLYRGVDRAILLTDRRAGGSDTLATSYILSCAIRKLDPDIVVCGRQAIDGDTAQVGPQPVTE